MERRRRPSRRRVSLAKGGRSLGLRRRPRCALELCCPRWCLERLITKKLHFPFSSLAQIDLPPPLKSQRPSEAFMSSVLTLKGSDERTAVGDSTHINKTFGIHMQNGSAMLAKGSPLQRLSFLIWLNYGERIFATVDP